MIKYEEKKIIGLILKFEGSSVESNKKKKKKRE
jgi:hypothetical protein